MNPFALIAVAFTIFLLAFLGLGISALLNRRERPGSCAHDPSEESSSGEGKCSVCGSGSEKENCRNECLNLH